MNIFRLIADMLHLSAILILIYRIRKSRNCIGNYFILLSLIASICSPNLILFAKIFTKIMNIGLSSKTQEMYLLVFCVRYLDLFMYFISMYNTLMKFFFISSSAYIIYLMRYRKPYCTVRNFYLIRNNSLIYYVDLRFFGR